jgi:hypothetical protein
MMHATHTGIHLTLVDGVIYKSPVVYVLLLTIVLLLSVSYRIPFSYIVPPCITAIAMLVEYNTLLNTNASLIPLSTLYRTNCRPRISDSVTDNDHIQQVRLFLYQLLIVNEDEFLAFFLPHHPELTFDFLVFCMKAPYFSISNSFISDVLANSKPTESMRRMIFYDFLMKYCFCRHRYPYLVLFLNKSFGVANRRSTAAVFGAMIIGGVATWYNVVMFNFF